MSSPIDTTSRVSEQPEEPYHELVIGFQSRLYAFISGLMAGDEGAADVLQETNLVLWEKSASYNRASSFAAWAYQIAHLQVLAYRKRKRRDGRLVFDEDLVSSLACDFENLAGDFDDSMLALQHCLGKLPSAHRTLIRQRYERQCSVASMAAGLGQTPNSLSAMLYRIRKALLRCMESRLKAEAVR